eukprot:gene8077-10785_t
MWVGERIVYFTLIRDRGPVYTVQAIYISAPAGVLYGITFFGEAPDLWLWISLALVILALWLNNRPDRHARQEAMKHPASKTIGYQLMHVARLHRARTARSLVSLGLFPGQEQVLEALADRESMTMSELADILRVRPPTASKTIGRLSAAGLIERRAGSADGRVVYVALTEAGRAKAA